LSNNPTISDHSPPSLPPPFPSRRQPITPIQAASIDPYTLLGVNRNSTITDIKKAYRKKALKLHPDVNKAPDAQERFLECKEAYATLIDIKQGTNSTNSNNNNSNSRSPSSSGYNRRSTGGNRQYNKQQQEEDFYGFTDFLRDLDKEIDNYATRRRAKRPGGDTQGAPKSLWEEMADLGEEFLEFLEDGLTSEEEEKKKGVVDTDDGGARARKAPPPPPSPPPRPQQQQPPSNTKPSKQVIEDELSELKKKLGL